MTAPTVDSGSSVAGLGKKAKGVTPPSGADRRGVFLTDVIVELGFAGEKEVEAVVEVGRTSTKPVEKLLLEHGVVDEEQLALAIAERNGLDHVDLEKFDVDMSAAAMITSSVGSRYGAVPIAFAPDGALIVAVDDPFDSLAICDIEVMTKSVVRPAIATPSAIHDLIERLPEVPVAPPAPADGEGGEAEDGLSMPRVHSHSGLLVAEAERTEGEEGEAADDGEEAEPEAAEAEPEAAEPETEAEPEAETVEDGPELEAEDPEVEDKHFEQLGAVLAQRAVPDPDPDEKQVLEVPSRALSEAPAQPEQIEEGSRAVRRAQRLEGELLVARRQISDLRRQLSEAGPQDPELKRRNAELEQRVDELDSRGEDLRAQVEELTKQDAELEEQKAELVQQNGELVQQNGDLMQRNARLELKVSDLEQRLGEVASVAEEATAMTAKLDALRRVIEKSRAAEPG
jgi:regulator of replication initiation timing